MCVCVCVCARMHTYMFGQGESKSLHTWMEISSSQVEQPTENQYVLNKLTELYMFKRVIWNTFKL